MEENEFVPFPGLRAIGYWHGPDQPDLQNPISLADHDWDSHEREHVATILSSAATHKHGEGCSTCRICGKPNGFVDLTDGTYVWPEGIGHYVKEHAVRLAATYVAHLIDAGARRKILESKHCILIRTRVHRRACQAAPMIALLALDARMLSA